MINANFTSVTEKIRSDVFKMGMHIKLRITLLNEIDKDILQEIVKARQKSVEELRKTYDSFEIELVF